MEVDGEVDSKIKMDQRKKRFFKQLRKADDFANLSPEFFAEQKEKWRQELRDIGQERNDLLPEHQKMQKLS